MNKALSFFYAGAGFSITVLNFIVVFQLIYHRKKKQGVKMSPIFEFLMNFVFVPLILEILGSAFYAFVPFTFSYRQIILDVLCKSYLVANLLWVSIFIFYTIMFIANNLKENKEKLKIDTKKFRVAVYTILTIICVIAGFVFSYEIRDTGGVFIVRGVLYSIMNMEFLISTIILYMVLIIYKNKLPNLKLDPYLIIFLLYFILGLLEIKLGYISNNLTSFFGLLIAVIYFTTESQDKMIIDNYTSLKAREKAINNTKKNLLINMSHEVRTPMHNIIGYIDILLNGDTVDSSDNLKLLSNESKRLKDTIENINDISKMNKNEIVVEQNTYDARKVYMQIDSFVSRNLIKDNLKFSSSVEQTLPSILYGDSEKIYKLLTKIIRNAIDCTSYGEVKLDVKGEQLDQQMLEITYVVSNSGHTMTDEMFDMSYEDYMISNNHSNFIKLDIIIAKKYVDLLGGTIEFENKPGNGTKYIVKLRQKIMSDSTIGNMEQ